LQTGLSQFQREELQAMSAHHISATHITEVGRLCRREVITISPEEDIASAARLMRTSHIGFLIVCEQRPERRGRKVVGVLTDRDIVVAVIARDADPHSLEVGDVMTRNPLMVAEDCSIDATLGFMHGAGVRRVPVLDAKGELVGVLSLDDVVECIARQLMSVVGAYRDEQRAERIVRP
jgi:CBS domain-containing protein